MIYLKILLKVLSPFAIGAVILVLADIGVFGVGDRCHCDACRNTGRSKLNPLFWLELLTVILGSLYAMVKSLCGKGEEEPEPCRQHDIFRRGERRL